MDMPNTRALTRKRIFFFIFLFLKFRLLYSDDFRLPHASDFKLRRCHFGWGAIVGLAGCSGAAFCTATSTIRTATSEGNRKSQAGNYQ